jgi:hypothetical protein
MFIYYNNFLIIILIEIISLIYGNASILSFTANEHYIRTKTLKHDRLLSSFLHNHEVSSQICIIAYQFLKIILLSF